MTANELGAILSDMYNDAPRGKQVTMIHLFGLKYHDFIRQVGVREVVQVARIKSTYITEVNKGVNLAEYAVPKPAYQR